jgi:hypothetical protein
VDPIVPIARSDRTVQPVALPRLRPLEREEERQRRERERKRRQRPANRPEKPAGAGDSGLDVRA